MIKKLFIFNFKILYFILTAGLLILIFYNFSVKFSFPDSKWELNKGKKIEIQPEKPVRQIFSASRDNLTKIRILFGKSNSKDGGKISLVLSDENCENSIRQSSFKRIEVSDGYYDFVFPKIKDSKDKVYCLSINFSPEKPTYKKFFVFLGKGLPPGSKYVLYDSEGGIGNKSLAMRPAYKNDNIFQDIFELNQRISQYKPWYFKHYYLYLAETFFILLSFLMILVLIFSL